MQAAAALDAKSDVETAIEDAPTHTMLYSTVSLCPTCLLVDKTGLAWKSAYVEERSGQVWLVCSCDKHGPHETHYCSNASFMRRVLKIGAASLPPLHAPGVVDVEDLMNKAKLSKDRPHNQPLMMEIALYRDGEFASDVAIATDVKKLLATTPEGKKFIVKLKASVARDMLELNSKALVVASSLPGTPVLLEVTYERLVALCELEESIFLKGWVYPAVKYFLRPGDEVQCLEDLQKLFKFVVQFSGIQMVITLGVHRPYPELSEVLKLLRSKAGLVRCIIFSQERPVDVITAQCQPEKKLSLQRDALSSGDLCRTALLNSTTTVVTSGTCFTEVRRVSGQGCCLRWRFKVRERDIKFSVECIPSDKGVLNVVVEPRRWGSKDGVCEGSIEDACPGEYTFKWDNSYSRVRKKIIRWAVVAEERLSSVDIPIDSLDPYDLLLSLEQASGDFFPLCCARVLEPFLDVLGYGSFSIRPSPFCCFAALLVTASDAESVPVTRYVDFDMFYTSSLPMVDHWTNGSIVRNLKTANKLRKTLQRSAILPLPDVVAYLTDSKKADATAEFLRNVQLVLVHNNMDVASVDLVRRCNCGAISSRRDHVAQCLGCV